jgi:hypothetical protein
MQSNGDCRARSENTRDHRGVADLFCSVCAHGLAQLDEATALNQQVVQLYNQARFSEALPLAQRTLAIREKASAPISRSRSFVE